VNELKLGLIFSVVFHITLVGVSVIGIPSLKRDFKGLPEPIPVEIVQIDDITRVVEPKLEREVAQEKPQAKTPKPKPAFQKPTENLSKNAVPLPDAKPKEKPKTPPKKEAVRLKPKVTPKPKPRPPSKLDMGKIAALIDRSKPKEEVSVAEVKEEDVIKKLEDAVRKNRVNALEARRATASLQAIIRQKVEACWSVPAGAKDADDLLVRLRISLRLDGTLSRPPEFLDRDRLFEGGQEFYRTAAESAARAVRRCAPYDLPKGQYSLWRQIDFNFDPKEMLGSGE